MSRPALAEPVGTPWPTQPLAELADTFCDGDWIESKDQSPSGVRLLQTGNVGEGAFKDRGEKARFISVDTFARLNCTEAFEGDILISRLPDPVGRACMVPESDTRMITAVDCSIVRLDGRRMLPKFFVYFTQSEAYLSAVEAQCTGTTRSRISRSALGRIEIPVPPLDEQKRIVAALDQAFAALDRARANAEANLADAEALFDAWLTQLFRERPPTWRTERLHVLCDQITVGHVGPMADRYSARGIPFLRSQNIRPFEISMIDVKSIDEQFHGELAKSALRPGDVAIVRTGYPGTAAVIPSSLPVSNCADLVIARPGKLISPDFLVMFLNSSFGKALVAEKSVGAAQKHFNVGAAREAELPFPDRAEQDRLVRLAAERRDVARGLSEAYRVKQSDIAELRQSLLQAAFSGQLS